MDDGQAKPTNINYSLYGQWYAGKLALRKTDKSWFVTFEDLSDENNPTMANFKLVTEAQPVGAGYSTLLHLQKKEKEKNPCREEVFTRGKGFFLSTLCFGFY